MVRMIKWMAPAVAALGLMLGTSSAQAAGGTVKGTVKDKEGNAAAGVEVRIVKPRAGGPGGAGAPKPDAKAEGEKPAAGGGAGGRGGNRPAPVATGKTDDKGAFTIENVPAGEYNVLVLAQGKGYAREKVTVEDGKTAEVNLKLADMPARGPGGAGGAGGGRRGGAGAGAAGGAK